MSPKSIRKNWFTLAETLLVCSIFAIMVVWIILAVNRSYTFMSNTKLKIQATNLAREWVEMMFNIRDTNWRKCSWKKDQFWLYLGSWAGINKEKECDTLGKDFAKWIFTINEWINWSWDTYVYANGLMLQQANVHESDINNFYSIDWFWNGNYTWAKISFSWSYYYRSEGKQEWNIKDLLGGVDFYRIVRVYGIYKKDEDNNAGFDISTDSSALTNWTPAEMRFCVKVFYRNHWDPHSSELCSIMTNFEE